METLVGMAMPNACSCFFKNSREGRSIIYLSPVTSYELFLYEQKRKSHLEHKEICINPFYVIFAVSQLLLVTRKYSWLFGEHKG